MRKTIASTLATPAPDTLDSSLPFVVHIVNNEADSVDKFRYADSFKSARTLALAVLIKYYKRKPCFARILSNDANQKSHGLYTYYMGQLRDVQI
jgi:hypothetical protein